LESKKEWLLFLFTVVIIFLISIFVEYLEFTSIKSSKIHTTKVLVVKQYTKTKKSKEYFVLKLKSEAGYSFYTTNKEDLKDLNGRYLEISFLTKNIKFIDFLRTFYAVSFNLKLLENSSIKSDAVSYIKKQHQNSSLQELYSALYVASSLSKNSMTTFNYFGISHLLAISGFHLTFILAFIMAILYYIYSPVHRVFLAHRSKMIDLSVISFVLLGGYLYVIDFTPSFTRAYVMYVLIALLYFRGIKLLSFTNLIVAILLILALNPRFIFSVGFYFSTMGVLYIYLFLYYLQRLSKIVIYLLINIWMFIVMLPVVHYFFPIFTFYQFLSVPITLLFPIFYFITSLLHIFTFGYLFDDYLVSLFDFLPAHIIYRTNIALFVCYNLISFFAIFYRVFFILLNVFMIIFFSYLVYLAI
jgi:competence protein ComEC